mgnify:CR=1 FL=1
MNYCVFMRRFNTMNLIEALLHMNRQKRVLSLVDAAC